MEDKEDTPCGMCCVGVYSELALINKKAVTFMSIDEDKREGAIPKCKRFDRKCVGYLHLHELKKEVDKIAK